MRRRNDIHVDDEMAISLLRRMYDKRLREYALMYNFDDDANTTEIMIDDAQCQGKIPDTVLSPGLKLELIDDDSVWKKGTLWVVVDPHATPMDAPIKCTDEQVVLAHYTSTGDVEYMVVQKNELDKKFVLK